MKLKRKLAEEYSLDAQSSCHHSDIEQAYLVGFEACRTMVLKELLILKLYTMPEYDRIKKLGEEVCDERSES